MSFLCLVILARYENADAKRILTTSHHWNWNRLAVHSCTTWLKVLDDRKFYNLTPTKAANMAWKWLPWKLFSASGTKHSISASQSE